MKGKDTPIQILDNKFVGRGEVKGFIFRKIKSTELASIYEVDSNTSRVHYEVFRNKLAPVCIDYKRWVYSKTELKQIYPKAKDFGDWAWTYYSLVKAMRKFKMLNDDNPK